MNDAPRPPSQAHFGKLEIGKVFRQAFSALFSNMLAFLFIAILFGMVPTLFAIALGGTSEIVNGNEFASTSEIVRGVMTFLVALICIAIIQGTVVYGTVRSIEGKRTPFRETVGRGLAMALPVVGISVLFAVGYVLSSLLLVIPGVIFYCTFFVVVAVAVTEHCGVMESFRRSRQLTKGNRWRILGLVLLWSLAIFPVMLVLMVVSFAVVAVLPLSEASAIALSSLQALADGITYVMMGCVSAAAYRELRLLHDGENTAEISAVFD